MTESIMTAFGLLSGQDALPLDSWFLSQFRHHLDELEMREVLRSFGAFGVVRDSELSDRTKNPLFGVFRQSCRL